MSITRSMTRSVAIAAAMLVGALLAIGAVVPVASAAPGTIRALDIGAPSLGQSISIASPGVGTYKADPGRALVRLTPAVGPVVQVNAWCVDRFHQIGEGVNYAVDLQTPADTPQLSSPGFQTAGWLIAAADGLIAAAANPRFEAGAIQVAVWQLTGQAADVVAVTPNSTLNARVAQLRALAAGKVLVTALALSGPTGATTVGSPATVTITGTAGAVVNLSVATGQATLSSTQVTLGASGSAQVSVTPGSAGNVVVSASALGGLLVRAAHIPGKKTPQDMAFVTPVTLSASVTLAAVAPVPAPAVAPAATIPAVVVSGPVAVAQVPAALRLTKSAPASARLGRSILYTLTVTNRSAQAARRVIIRDPLPSGTFVGDLPKAARLRSGAVVWRLGTLAPRASVTVRLRLRTSVAALGDVLNIASASASNAATVRARARTRLVSPPRVAPIPTVFVPVTG